MPKPLSDSALLSALAGTAPFPPKIMRTRALGFGNHAENKNAPAKYLFHRIVVLDMPQMLFIPRPTVIRPYPLAASPDPAIPKNSGFGAKQKDPPPPFPTDAPGERKQRRSAKLR
jgi:hypothetical protein